MKPIRCRRDTYCPGLTSHLGRHDLRVALIFNLDTHREWNVVVIGKYGRHKEQVVLNYCPFCGARLNAAYYRHCMSEPKETSGAGCSAPPPATTTDEQETT